MLGPKEGLAADQRHRRHAGNAGAGVRRLRGALSAADVVAAMSVEALLGTDAAFAADRQRACPHPGQLAVPPTSRVMAGSAIVASHRGGDTRVQDAYSMRCAPAGDRRRPRRARSTRARRDSELRSAVDNPSVLATAGSSRTATSTASRSASPRDFLAIAAAEVGAIAERRVDRLLDATGSMGLPPFLADDPGSTPA